MIYYHPKETIISKLKKENKKLQKENDKFKLIINQLIRTNKEFQRRLSYYEGPHTPPSSNSLKWKKLKQEKRETNKDATSGRGGVTGHRGTTEKFRSERTQKHELFICPKCDSSDICKIKTRCKVMVDIPEPQPHLVTKHVSYRYSCNNCNSTFASDANLRMGEPINDIRMYGQTIYGLSHSNSFLSILMTYGNIDQMVRIITNLRNIVSPFIHYKK